MKFRSTYNKNKIKICNGSGLIACHDDVHFRSREQVRAWKNKSIRERRKRERERRACNDHGN